MVEHLIDT